MEIANALPLPSERMLVRIFKLLVASSAGQVSGRTHAILNRFRSPLQNADCGAPTST
jgi:hypothetical protein